MSPTQGCYGDGMRPTTTHSRRRVLQSGAGVVLSAALWPGALRAADRDAGEFRFFCVNDLHCQDEECGRWLESRVIRSMKDVKEPVDFCLIVGDLAENGTAVVVVVRSRASVPLRGVPIEIQVIGPGAKALFKNDQPGIDPALVGPAVLLPGKEFAWVNDQVLAQGKATSVKVTPAGPPAPRPEIDDRHPADRDRPAPPRRRCSSRARARRRGCEPR